MRRDVPKSYPIGIYPTYDKHHKLFPNPNLDLNTSNSVKHVIRKRQIILSNMQYPLFQMKVTCISGEGGGGRSPFIINHSRTQLKHLHLP